MSETTPSLPSSSLQSSLFRPEAQRKIFENAAGFDTVFVVVGAAHLTGPEGLIALLIREGYAKSS